MPDNPDLYDAVTDLDHSPIYAYPQSFEDRRQGRIVDGFWVPGHMLDYVNGQPVIKGEMEPRRHQVEVET